VTGGVAPERNEAVQTGAARKHDWHGMVMHKCKESVEVKEKFLDGYAELIGELSSKMAARFEQGHQLWVMGNGGSACQMAVLTAIANDKDYARVFVDQIELHGKAGDMALAISTSGNSPNLIYALEAAKRKEILTIAFSGKDGGRLAGAAEYCFTVPSYSTHRIQESHVTLLHILWDLIHVSMGEEDVI
jgi:D-sedoheptulose 7-phosphate isomerase